MSKLPDKYMIPGADKIPILDQGDIGMGFACGHTIMQKYPYDSEKMGPQLLETTSIDLDAYEEFMEVSLQLYKDNPKMTRCIKQSIKEIQEWRKEAGGNPVVGYKGGITMISMLLKKDLEILGVRKRRILNDIEEVDALMTEEDWDDALMEGYRQELSDIDEEIEINRKYLDELYEAFQPIGRK